MATQITLPKDAEGKEVPLDTKLLYDEYGNQRHIAQFIYHHECETGAEKWTVEYDNGVERFVSVMHLNQPDSWEKLEEDLSRAADSDGIVSCCRYFNADECANCPIHGNDSYCVHKEGYAFGDILNRIRKLRGEG